MNTTQLQPCVMLPFQQQPWPETLCFLVVHLFHSWFMMSLHVWHKLSLALKDELIRFRTSDLMCVPFLAMLHLTNAWRESHYIWHKHPFELMHKLFRIRLWTDVHVNSRVSYLKTHSASARPQSISECGVWVCPHVTIQIEDIGKSFLQMLFSVALHTLPFSSHLKPSGRNRNVCQ